MTITAPTATASTNIIIKGQQPERLAAMWSTRPVIERSWKRSKEKREKIKTEPVFRWIRLSVISTPSFKSSSSCSWRPNSLLISWPISFSLPTPPNIPSRFSSCAVEIELQSNVLLCRASINWAVTNPLSPAVADNASPCCSSSCRKKTNKLKKVQSNQKKHNTRRFRLSPWLVLLYPAASRSWKLIQLCH